MIAIIPARYASTRFPGKPLALLGGKPMVQHVYEQVSKVLDEVYVATDDERICQVVEDFGGRAIMTSPHHPSGTDRVYEAYCKSGSTADLILNVQGDEPFVQPEQIEAIARCFVDHPATQIATLAKPFTEHNTFDELFDSNTVKLTFSPQTGQALYFSRSIIPYKRGLHHTDWLRQGTTYYKHLGMYAYRAEVLRAITQLAPSSLEQAESLEQLRWLEAGYRVSVGVTHCEAHGIDTPEDLEKAERSLTSH